MEEADHVAGHQEEVKPVADFFFFQPVVDFSASFSGFILQVCTW